MTRRRSGHPAIWLPIAIAALTVLVLSTRGPATPTPNPPGTFAFGALGDAPYYPFEVWRYPLMLQDMDGNDLAFSIHVGDIFWRPCSDEMYERSLRWFNSLKHPLIYTPGDNEWTDCWTEQEGGFNPRDRLARVRQTMYPTPGYSLGRQPLPVETQAAYPGFAEFIEHVRWSQSGVVFATIHVVGSGNANRQFPARTDEDDQESRRRLEAARAWVLETFARAKQQSATAVVVAFHADPGFDWSPADQAPFTPILDAFENEAVAFGKPVLLIHGDSHHFIIDHPLRARATKQTIANVTRLQVPGSPLVGWVRVVVTPSATTSFAFDQRLVPRWKYW